MSNIVQCMGKQALRCGGRVYVQYIYISFHQLKCAFYIQYVLVQYTGNRGETEIQYYTNQFMILNGNGKFMNYFAKYHELIGVVYRLPRYISFLSSSVHGASRFISNLHRIWSIFQISKHFSPIRVQKCHDRSKII